MPDWKQVGKYAAFGAMGMSPWEMSYMDQGRRGGRQPSEAVRKGSVLVPITKPRIGAWDTGLPKPIATLGGQPAGARQVPETTMVPRREAEALHETSMEAEERRGISEDRQIRFKLAQLIEAKRVDFPGNDFIFDFSQVALQDPDFAVSEVHQTIEDITKNRNDATEKLRVMMGYLKGKGYDPQNPKDMGQLLARDSTAYKSAKDVMWIFSPNVRTFTDDEGNVTAIDMNTMKKLETFKGIDKVTEPTPTKPEYIPGLALEKIAAAQKSKATFNKTGIIDAIMAKMFPEYTEGQKLTKSEINKVNKAYDELISHLEKFTPEANRDKAIKLLQDAGEPVTEANINYIINQF